MRRNLKNASSFSTKLVAGHSEFARLVFQLLVPMFSLVSTSVATVATAKIVLQVLDLQRKSLAKLFPLTVAAGK